MNYEVIVQKVISMFAMLADTENEITVESELIEDLGFSSMDVLMLVCDLEEEFKIKIPEKLIRSMETIGDVVEVIESLL